MDIWILAFALNSHGREDLYVFQFLLVWKVKGLASGLGDGEVMLFAPGKKNWPNFLLYKDAEIMYAVSYDASAQLFM